MFLCSSIDDCHLHTETDTEERYLVLSRVAYRLDHTLDASVTEAAGNYDTVAVSERFSGVLGSNFFGVYPLYINCCIIDDTAVAKRLCYGKISVVELDVLADKSYHNVLVGVLCAAYHFCPFCKVRSVVRESEVTAYRMCKTFIFEPQRNFIQ